MDFFKRKPRPTPGMLGSGMAAHAGRELQDRDYQLHVAEATANGNQPLPYAEYQRRKQSTLGGLYK